MFAGSWSHGQDTVLAFLQDARDVEAECMSVFFILGWGSRVFVHLPCSCIFKAEKTSCRALERKISALMVSARRAGDWQLSARMIKNLGKEMVKMAAVHGEIKLMWWH